MAAAKSSASSEREARRHIIEASIPRLSFIFRWLTSLRSLPKLQSASKYSARSAFSRVVACCNRARPRFQTFFRGENEGRNLTHAAVLRSLTHVRAQHVTQVRQSTNNVILDPSWKHENLRFVVFLQEPKTLHIFGAAASSISINERGCRA